MPPDELSSIVANYHPKRVAKGAFILQQGEVCRFEGFVAQGCFKVSTINAEGVEKVLHFAAQNWWVMEIGSFANETPSGLTIQALEDSTILVIAKADKDRLYREYPRVERLFRLIYQKSVVAWQQRLLRNHTLNAEERYGHFVDTYPEIAAVVTNKLIASYLGITQEFLSVIRKRRAERNQS